MRISKVNIKDFKRFKDLTIDLGKNPARIVALVGLNGCGKSSIFDAFLSYVLLKNNKIGKTEQFHHHFSYNNTHSIFFKDKENYHNKITIDFNDELNYSLNKYFSFRSPYRYSTDLKVKEIKSIENIGNNSYGADSSIMLDKRMEDNYRHLLAYYNKYRDSNDKRPSEAREEVIGELNNSIKNCLDLEICNLGNVEGDEGTLFFKKSESEEEFEFDCLSAGEKEVVDLLLDLFLRSKEYADSIFLFDEPELHIHTSIQRKLLKEINNMVGENGQIWIATHSIGFLRALQEDFFDNTQIIKFDPTLHLSINQVTLEPISKTRTDWLSLFQIALDDLTNLLSPKRIIYCEGKDKPNRNGEEQGMDAKVLNNIFNIEYPDSLFVSSGGNTELDQRSQIAIAILNKALPDVEIWVFKDRDIASGKNVTENDRLDTLNMNDSSIRIMKRWEIENYLFDKEVLQKYCEKSKKEFDDNKYELLTKGKDINNDDYKKLGSEFVKVCGINTSINQDKFKEELSKCITSDMKVYQELKACIFDRK